MEVNTIDQLIRPDSTAAASNRRANDQGSNPFSSLLEARTERPRAERPRAERLDGSASSAKSANGPNMKTRKNDHDSAAEKSERAEAKDRPAPKERAGRDDKAHASEKTERPAAPESKRQIADAGHAKAPAAEPDAGNPADTAADDSSADAEAQATAIAVADADSATVTVAVAVDPNLNEIALPVAAEFSAQTIDAPQPVAVAIAAQLETQAAADPEAATSAATAVAPALAAPVADDGKKLEAAAAVAAQEIAKPTSSLSEQQASSEIDAGEDYADFMLRNLAATPAVAAAEKDAAKADAKAKETPWNVTIAPTAMATAPVAPTTALAVQAAADTEAAAAIDANAPKAQSFSIDDDGDAKPAAKTAEGTAQFAQHLDPSRDARAADELRAPARAPATPAHEQVAVHVRKAVAEGLDQITIRLNPAELGRIDVKIEVGNDGSLRAAFAADKQATLDLLKGDSRQLEQALSEAGLSTDAGGLNFSLRGDNRENAQAFRQLGEEFARNRDDDPAANEAPAPLAAGSYARRNAGPGRIDLNA